MVKIDMTGRVALITGAGGGLGRAYALELAARGAAVVVNDLGGDPRGFGGSKALADDVVEEIRAAGGRAIASYDNIATCVGGEAAVRAALDEFNRIDIVVNNAGNQRNAPFGDISEEDLDSVLGVHLKGAFFVTQPAYRYMLQHGYGRIILTSSQSGLFGSPYRANYGTAKTAMIGLMNTIAQEAPSGIAINCLFPVASGGRLMNASIGPRIDQDFLDDVGERWKQLVGRTDPSYVAAMLVYLASEQCISSQGMYSVVGGRYARVFAGVTQGWVTPEAQPPSAEEVLARIERISDVSNYTVPLSGLEEMDDVIAALDR